MRTENIALGDLQLHCRVEGPEDAPMLLLLHGFPEYGGAWDDMIPRLSDRYLCVAPDQRGYGKSSKPQGVENYAGRKLAADAAGLIAHYRPGGQAHVFGHDWGAGVAYALAIGAPQLVSRLVIANGVHPLPFQRALATGGAQAAASQYIPWLRSPGSHDKLSENDCALLKRMLRGKMDTAWLTPELEAQYLAAWSAPGAVEGMVNWYRAAPIVVPKPGETVPADQLPKLDPHVLRIRMPHLLLWGMEDTALLPESREGLQELCDSGFELVEFSHADHWILHQKPAEIAAELRRFLG